MGGGPGMGGIGGLGGAPGEGRPEAGMAGGFGAMGGGTSQFAGVPGMGGGRGGGGGMEGGGGPGGGGRGGMGGLAGAAGRLQMAGRLQQNRLRVQLTYNLSGSPFNAQPYAINGQSSAQPTNVQHRFGVNLGGRAKIPGVFDLGTRSNFFLNYSGNHGSALHDSYSRVPTAAQRAGDLSSSAITLYDPLTGSPFANNQIPAERISAAAASLLTYYPLPNQDSTDQNYHYATATVSHSDDVNLRFMRSFGTVQRGRGGFPGGGRGGMGGPGGGSANLSVGVQLRRSTGDQTTNFPTAGGKNRQTRLERPGRSHVPEVGPVQHAEHSVQPQPLQDDEPLRERPRRGGRGRHLGRLDRPVLVGRAVALLHERQRAARHHAVGADGSDGHVQPDADEDAQAPRLPLGRGLPVHAERQPVGLESARVIRLHGPLLSIDEDLRLRQRSRRLPARHAPAGVAAVRPREAPVPRTRVERLRAGRLAREEQSHHQRGRPLRVPLAVLGGATTTS